MIISAIEAESTQAYGSFTVTHSSRGHNDELHMRCLPVHVSGPKIGDLHIMITPSKICWDLGRLLVGVLVSNLVS